MVIVERVCCVLEDLNENVVRKGLPRRNDTAGLDIGGRWLARGCCEVFIISYGSSEDNDGTWLELEEQSKTQRKKTGEE